MTIPGGNLTTPRSSFDKRSAFVLAYRTSARLNLAAGKFMNTTVHVWGAALLLSLACWGVGSALVTSRRPIVGMLCGWCCFLLLCTIPWIAGFSAHAMRPLFWAFFTAGMVVIIHGRRWPELICAILCTGAVSALLCAPYLLYPGVLAYGAHGTDMWGYVCTSEWLYGHSLRNLPDVGNAPMRFNWVWYVLHTRERPLIYESLACLGSASGLTPVQAYITYPAVLLASVAMAVCREQRVFGLKHWTLALLPAIALVIHPLIILHWIAGFFSGSIVGPYTALAFAAVAVVEEGRARTEVLALALLMMVFCAGLYSGQFLLVGLIVAGVPAMVTSLVILWRKGWRSLLGARPGWLASAVLSAASVLTVATLALSGDEFVGSAGGHPELSRKVMGEFLGVFGASSPYSWLMYRPLEPRDLDPLHNPVGCAALIVMAILFGLFSWRRWQTSRDIQVPLLVGVCVGCLWQVGGDTGIMAKLMPIFGFALLPMLATVSGELRPWRLGLAAAVVCCMSSVRSGEEIWSMVHGPYITISAENRFNLGDGDSWRVMAYLHFWEDTEGLDWTKRPKTYFALTCYLPEQFRQRLAQKYHLPPP